MSLQPTSEQWQVLLPVERFNFKVTHSFNSSPIIRPILTKLCVVFGGPCVEIATSNIVLDHGFENFEKIDPNRGALLQISKKVMEAIDELAKREQDIRAEFAGKVQETALP